MFTSFATENTPAIQVWNFFSAFQSTSAPRSVFLADDCAPIQLFKTGATTTNIVVYLPSSPIEGRQIRLINARHGTANQKLTVCSSDVNGAGTALTLYTVGSGQVLDLIYTNSTISLVSTSGTYGSGWVSINQGHVSSASYSSVCFGYDNQATAVYSGVFAGSSNTANASGSVIFGGTGNTASGTNSAVAGGSNNTASNSNASILGGTFNTANSTSSAVYGGSYGSTRLINGIFVTPASITPIASTAGAQQTGLLILGRQTTDATTTTLCSNNSAAGTTNQVILPDNSAFYFRGTVIANVTGGGDTKAWTFDGAIKRGAGVGTTALVGIPTVISNYANAGAAAWTIALAADTTNGGLQVTVTGAAATTIRWVCRIETTEVTY